MAKRQKRVVRKFLGPLALVTIIVFIVFTLPGFIIFQTYQKGNGSLIIVNEGGAPETDAAQEEIIKLNADPLAISADKFTTVTKNRADVKNGSLVLVNTKRPFEGTISELTDFTDESNVNGEFFLSVYGLQFSKEIAAPIDRFTRAYTENFKRSNIYIYNTMSNNTEEFSLCPDYIEERSTGCCIDIMIRDVELGKYDVSQSNSYQWILENCGKYGFIQRYPADKSEYTGTHCITYHFRYVGIVHASYMYEHNMCLEEYLQELKNHTYDNSPIIYQINNRNYEIYYEMAAPDSITQLHIPDGYDSSRYRISGNNVDGFIVTVAL
jgi:D-alanyl-D-alanine carboxypeptidase